MCSIILVQIVGGVLFMPKSIQFTCITPFWVSHKTFWLCNKYFGIWKGIT